MTEKTENEQPTSNLDLFFAIEQEKELYELNSIINRPPTKHQSIEKQLTRIDTIDAAQEFSDQEASNKAPHFHQADLQACQSHASREVVTWTELEDKILLMCAKENGIENWNKIGRLIYKPPSQCKDRYYQLKKPADGFRKWTPEEDQLLRELVIQQETYKWRGQWSKVADDLIGRTPNQCRQRWNLKIDPRLSPKKPWTPQEDLKLIQLYSKYGPSWKLIQNQFEGRSYQEIINHYKQGLDKHTESSVKLKAALYGEEQKRPSRVAKKQRKSLKLEADQSSTHQVLRIVNGCFQMIRVPKEDYEQQKPRIFSKPVESDYQSESSSDCAPSLGFSLDEESPSEDSSEHQQYVNLSYVLEELDSPIGHSVGQKFTRLHAGSIYSMPMPKTSSPYFRRQSKLASKEMSQNTQIYHHQPRNALPTKRARL